MVRELVVSWGMRDGSAEDGYRALEMLRSAAEAGDPYDLAILDGKMPGMDGMELARRIKEDPSIASIRLVMANSGGRCSPSVTVLSYEPVMVVIDGVQRGREDRG